MQLIYVLNLYMIVQYYRYIHHSLNEACRRIMISRYLIFQILEGIHDICGHQGLERVIHRVKLEMNLKGKYKISEITLEDALCVTRVRV